MTDTDDKTGADAAAATTTVDGDASSQPQGDALEQRIRSDPDFAYDQYRRVKGESTKLYQRIKANEAILKIADQLGGADVAAGLMGEYAAVAVSPEVARIREYYKLHGTLPPASSTRNDDTLDDVYKDPQQVELESLRAELGQLRATVSDTRANIGKQGVRSMLTQLKNDYPDGFEEFILPKFESSFAEWDKTPSGREVLASLTLDQMKSIANMAIGENLDAISEKRHLRILEQKKKATTGVPSQVMSTGREPAANKRAMNHLDVLREFRREHGENYS